MKKINLYRNQQLDNKIYTTPLQKPHDVINQIKIADWSVEKINDLNISINQSAIDDYLQYGFASSSGLV